MYILTKQKNQLVTISPNDLDIFQECDKAFDKKNVEYSINLLQPDESISVRTRAVCILADIDNEEVIPVLSEILKNDKTSLVRHEAAFTLGQLGCTQSVPALIDAMLSDSNNVVRHESAVALGSIGDQSARNALINATNDNDKLVVHSAFSSLLNLDHLQLNLKTKLQRN